MDNLKPEKNKEGWFEHLEAESWSAELIISGAAVYGSLQLPWLLSKMVNFSLLNFSDDILSILYLFYTYLTFSITILIVNFVLHFILRSLWVSLIGLSSVFPHGVNEESESYGKNYLQKLKADFGNLRAYTEKIDRTCSIMFAFSFSVALIFTSIALMVLAVAGLSYLIHQLNPKLQIQILFFSILFLLILPGFLGSILNLKFMRDKEWVQKIHYNFMVNVAGRITFHVFFQPIYYINSTFATNLKKGQYTLRMVGYMFLILPAFIVIFIQSNVLFANKSYYFGRTEREDRLYAQHYADQLKENQIIQNPVIPSAEIEGSGVSLFLPLPTREEIELHKKYGEYKQDSTLSDPKNLVQNRAWFKEQAKKYFQIEVNDKKFLPARLRSYDHPNAKEYGLLTFIPDTLLQPGENIIHIQSEYRLEGKKRECFIPFWFKNE